MAFVLILITLSNHSMHIIFDDMPACKAALEQVQHVAPNTVGVCVATSSEKGKRHE